MTPKDQEKQAVHRIKERLGSASIGETISHNELRQIIGSGLRYDHYWYVGRARLLLNRESGIVFATVNREGYRRLGSAPGVGYVGERGLRRIRSAAKRGYQFLVNAVHHANDLEQSQAAEANRRLCALGLIEHLSRPRTLQHLSSDPPPPPPDGLDGLKRAMGL